MQTRTKQVLSFSDAGHAYNDPLFPLFHPERKVDIIFVLDASAGIHNPPEAGEFRKAENDLKEKGFAIPKINYEGILKKPVSVFQGGNKQKAPTIIFVAPIKNEKYDKKFDTAKEFSETYPSGKFVYKKEKIEKLTGLIKFNLKQSKNEILKAIREHIEMKKSITTANKQTKGWFFTRLFKMRKKTYRKSPSFFFDNLFKKEDRLQTASDL